MMKRVVRSRRSLSPGFAVVSAQEGGQAPARGGRGAGPEEQLVLVAESEEAERVGRPAQAAHEARRGAGEAQGPGRLGRADRRRRQPACRLHLDGARQEDAAQDERRYPRVVGDSGRPDSLHDRRAGAVRGVEGLPGPGAVSEHVHDGNGRRSAVAALRSEHREGPEDVSDGREARAVPGFDFVPVRVAGKGTYAEGNKPFVDFNAVAAGTDKTRRFVHDDRAVANIILGPGHSAARR